jgi:Protein of unknown function (DUF2004)
MSYAGRSLSVGLTLEQSDTPPDLLRDVLKRADNLVDFDAAARLAITEDVTESDDSAARLYVDHHLAECSKPDLERAFVSPVPDDISHELFLSHLVLVRVGIYPEQDEAQILLDYSIGYDLTNYILCVSFNSNGQVEAVDMES